MVITKEMMAQASTGYGGWTAGQIQIARRVAGKTHPIRSMVGKEIDEAQWLEFVRHKGKTKKKAIKQSKAKRANPVINAVSVQSDGWSWRPQKEDIPGPKFKAPSFATEAGREKSDKRKARKDLKRKRLETIDARRGFYESKEWLSLRVRVLQKYACKCMMCGRNPRDHGIVIHVDHIKPRSKYPELELEFNNLQLLCEDCNVGKSNKYDTDYRPKAVAANEVEELEILAEARARI